MVTLNLYYNTANLYFQDQVASQNLWLNMTTFTDVIV